jgi:hypothetical protein
VKTIWTAQCILANEVNLNQEDWEHIVDGHPEMAGREELVKLAIQKPIFIQEAGNPVTAAYVLPPDQNNPEGVRVIVGFSSELWPTGNKVGDVKTGYPIDTKAYPHPELGQIIWPKPKAGAK